MAICFRVTGSGSKKAKSSPATPERQKNTPGPSRPNHHPAPYNKREVETQEEKVPSTQKKQDTRWWLNQPL